MDIIEKINRVLDEEGEGVASPGTTTSDVAKVPQGTQKSYKEKKKKKKWEDEEE